MPAGITKPTEIKGGKALNAENTESAVRRQEGRVCEVMSDEGGRSS